MILLKKIKKYIYVFYDEYKYRVSYILLFLGVIIGNIFIFWNEILIFLLNPLETILLKNNKIIIHEILSKHYDFEDFYIKDIKNLNIISQNTNEMPYFEMNISDFESVDNLFLIIYMYFIVILITPYIIYQLLLFTIPLCTFSELKMFVHIILNCLISIIVTYYIIYNFTIPFFIKNILVATEEISYYEFELEITLEKYLFLFLKVIIFHHLIILYLFINKYNITFFLLIAIVISIFITSQSITELCYFLFSILIAFFTKKTLQYIILLKYAYCFRMHRNIKSETFFFQSDRKS